MDAIRQFLALTPSDMASASTVDLRSADSYIVRINGDNTIHSLGTEEAGLSYWLAFTHSAKIVHNDDSLVMPDRCDVETNPGDIYRFTSNGLGNWACTSRLGNEDCKHS